MTGVVIGMDPHKRSVTIEVMTPDEAVLDSGRHVTVRLLADGEQVLDVAPTLSARLRVYSTGQGRKTDATDAHSIALVGTRMVAQR